MTPFLFAAPCSVFSSGSPGPLGGRLPGAPASSPLAQHGLCPLTLAEDLVTGFPEPQEQDPDGRNLQMELIVLVGGQLLCTPARQAVEPMLNSKARIH